MGKDKPVQPKQDRRCAAVHGLPLQSPPALLVRRQRVAVGKARVRLCTPDQAPSGVLRSLQASTPNAAKVTACMLLWFLCLESAAQSIG